MTLTSRALFNVECGMRAARCFGAWNFKMQEDYAAARESCIALSVPSIDTPLFGKHDNDTHMVPLMHVHS